MNTALIDLAKSIATAAHEGQVDKLGAAYIGHPARVAAHAERLGGSEQAIAAAWLHDVIEDTPLTSADLLARGISSDVVNAVLLLSKTSGQGMEEYCSGIRGNPLALLVKEADLADNTDPARTALLDQSTRERLAEKYAATRRLLNLS
ncbi:HD domain-containing protein [Glutamicibacter sp.]|uniref:HD domain-containing protein n=1 Tax=Glutamicibacter sp. TaxID=1931995 RepID=UPI0028BF2705|nr:HD domain-containing protein [Glutamicibacter sp.]